MSNPTLGYAERECISVNSFSPEETPEAFLQKETLTQEFSCEFCQISKNAVSYRAPPMAASVSSNKLVSTKLVSNHSPT